jgi:tetratricopeptide (TPR) repeat protein
MNCSIKYFLFTFCLSAMQLSAQDTAVVNGTIAKAREAYSRNDYRASAAIMEKIYRDASGKTNYYRSPEIHFLLAKLNLAMGDQRRARLLLDSALLMANASGNLRLASEIIIRKGSVFSETGEPAKALELYFSVLKYFEQSGAEDILSDLYQRIGVAFKKQGNLKEALNYYHKVVKSAQKNKNYSQLASILNNLGSLYYQQEQVDSALHYFIKADSIGRKQSDVRLRIKIGTNLATVSGLKQNNFSKALKYFKETLALCDTIRDLNNKASLIFSLGESYFRMGDEKQAEKEFLKALVVAKQNNIRELLVLIYTRLYTVKLHKKEFDKALLYYQAEMHYKDSLNSEKDYKRGLELQMQSELDRRSLADSLKNAEKERMTAMTVAQERSKRKYLYLVIGMMVLLSGFIYNRFLVSRKQRRLIQLQKEEVEFQKKLVDQKQKEVLDSIRYAKRIQLAQIPSEKRIAGMLRKVLGK